MIEFFKTPKDMLNRVNEKGVGLRGTLGWHEMESAMLTILQRMADGTNHWLFPVDICDFCGLCTSDPFSEGNQFFHGYFDKNQHGFFISTEALVKLHMGIAGQ